jgi:pimeloyl-ACP methyl ester carboxylesterase
MRKYPDGVRGLVLADTNAHADDEETRAGRTKLIESVAANGPASAAEAMIPKLLSEKGAENAEVVAEVRRMIETTSSSGIVSALHGMANRPDLTELLGAIAVPTLVVVGERDATIGVEKAEKMAAAIPNARLEVIEEAGHLSNLETPDEFNRLLREFLDELSKPGDERSE